MLYSAFVSRQPELASLHNTLQQILQGQGQVLFISGDAGSGKSTLVREFCRQSQVENADLGVAFGQSDAETGVGDPNLIFREILAQLTGDLDSGVAQVVITEENASRLRNLFELSVQALVDVGPDLIGVFLPGAGLLAKVGTFAVEKTGWLDKLGPLVNQKPATGSAGLEQDHIFEQYTRVLQEMSKQHPIVLVLDDLHWADQASISLLFHLGRRINRSRIFIIGTYRPQELAVGRRSQATGHMERHPLDKVVVEFKRYYGDIHIDLNNTAEVEGRHFVDNLLDTEPNTLDAAFRQALFEHTKGNPLFIIELLREMQERGDLVRDSNAGWVEKPELRWDALPARIEGVIQERVGRLDDDPRELLNVASVEGESFTAEVVARVQEEDARTLVRIFSRELVQRHRLVTGQGIQRLPSGQRLSLYKFNHKLLQNYLYNNLDEVQRVLAHEDIAYCLEDIYSQHVDEITVQLAHHFTEAGIRDKSIFYLRQAGERAASQFAFDDASDYFSRALGLIEPEKEIEDRFLLLGLRERALAMPGAGTP
ncbi:MAG: AAA family ATPase [Anaerolineae bacterium]|nr:AAA family ATPase [Anaerolineae bacterium]